MRIRYIIIILFSIVFQQTKAQVSLKFPTNKSHLYEHPEYYKSWKKSSLEREERFKIQNLKEYNYWNRFIDYFKALTDDPNDIMYIFFDGFLNDKDSFCYNYKDMFEYISTSRYYKREIKIMDNLCGCVFMAYNKKLIAQLINIKNNDQLYRFKENTNWEKQHHLDSINQNKLQSIFDQYGYPGRKIVGIEYEDIFFRVIQHSNLNLMEKYLPIVENEIKKSNLYKGNYPLLHDRINMLKGLPQEYGTQIKYDKNGNSSLYKTINDINKLNKNRAEYNLLPINEI